MILLNAGLIFLWYQLIFDWSYNQYFDRDKEERKWYNHFPKYLQFISDK